MTLKVQPEIIDQRMDMLIERLPTRLRRWMRWLMRPAARWVRIPAGILLVLGGIFIILPLLGFWMIPLGIILLAEDISWCRKLRDKTLDWLERRRPLWFSSQPGR